MSRKIAVVLFNLGGPDGQKSIAPFLYNFFTDRNIIALPFPLRHMLALLIAWRRSRREAGVSYGFLNGVSPLLANSRAQAVALEQALNGDGEDVYRTFVSMRYWHPRAHEVARDVRAWGPDRVVLLPLYPQYSTTTTRSSLEEWMKAARAAHLSVPASAVCCYPADDGFIAASVERIREAYAKIPAQYGHPRLLFSAHGLPEKIIAGGDPYQWQCEESARRIAKALNMPDLDWQICYQSRVGRLKWIGPSTAEALEQAAADHVPVIVYPHAFVSEHVETLVEIEIEYRHLAETLGVPYFGRVETAGIHAGFIGGLKKMILQQSGGTGLSPGHRACICPESYKRCALRDKALAL